MPVSTPLITIVIPTYNQIEYLAACIDHCLFQTYEKLEIVVVDGGSTDGTKEYLAVLPDRIKTHKMNPIDRMSKNAEIVREEILVYPQNRKLKIVTFKKNIGATNTYNEGLKRASGKYCTYIVGDDIPHPHMIAEMAKILEDGKFDFIYSDANLIDDQSCIIRQMKFPDYDFKKCFAEWFHLGVSKLYKTDLHRSVGLMDERYSVANDYDHYLRFAMSGCRFYHLPKILYSVRWHGPERKVGQHTPERYLMLLEESKRCASRARVFLNESNKS